MRSADRESLEEMSLRYTLQENPLRFSTHYINAEAAVKLLWTITENSWYKTKNSEGADKRWKDYAAWMCGQMC